MTRSRALAPAVRSRVLAPSLVAPAALAALTALAALLVAPAPASAQRLVVAPPPPPTLVVTDGTFQKALAITSLDVQARIVGHLAETTMTMTFFNPGSRVLAGDLTFPLPAGSTVSGYGLDVDGAIVDGVVVEKQEARRIFEAEVRKGVDPGLVEQVAGAAYRTRVFPIPAKGSRTVRVSWISEVAIDGADARYHLPLGFTEPIDEVHVRIDVVRATGARVEGEGLDGLTFAAWEDRQVAETSGKKLLLDRPVSVVLPDLPSRPVAVERAPDGHTYFSIHTQKQAPASSARITPRRVGLLWDTSLSRKDADTAREIGLIEAWAARLGKGKVTVDLVTFADVAQPPVRFTLPADIRALADHLRAATYDGGTGLSSLQAAAAAIPADLYLLFTDGVANLGVTTPPTFSAPVYALNGAAVANHDSLRAMALASGGAWLDLSTVSDASAIEAIGRSPFAFRGHEGAGLGESYPRIAEPVDGAFSFAGRLTAEQSAVSLAFEGAGAGRSSETFTVRAADATEGTLLQRFWAQKKVADLAVGGKANESAIAAVGTSFGIVTAGTSLLVLERLDQYVEYEVRPPASLPAMRKDWDRQMAERSKQQKAVSQQRLDRIVQLWQERVAWWDKEFDLTPPKDQGIGTRGTGYGGGGDGRGLMNGAMEDEAPMEESRMMDAEMEAPASVTTGASRGVARDDDDARPSKKAKEKDSGAEAPPPPSIALRPWDPSTPYLAALKAAKESEWAAIYLRERDTWGTAPAYFLDCSDFFAQRDRPAVARRVLSNLVELELEDPALLRVFARRLVQLGELDLAIVTFERIVELRPDEPQSHRDLALALSDRADLRAGDKARKAAALADYQAALDGLARVVMDEWDRFAEIELIALVELNDVLVRAQRLGEVRVPVDSRLVKQLDMDIRIVMSWDADMTDMDLHVIEPSGEEAYYGHARTRIGGRVSRDFTQGYGPEEYSIRKAMKGNYVVRTKFFGSSAAELQGAVTLTLDLYTDYGRPTEHHEAITIRLAENKDTFTVGEITFEGSKAPRQVTR